mgnify:CR=1 FL=1
MNDKQSVHWVGAGLSSGPGIVDLANTFRRISVWDTNTDNAVALRQHLKPGGNIEAQQLDLNCTRSVANFAAHLNAGDVVVSMLPAALHVRLAEIAIGQGANLVTSSYLSDEMLALDDAARERNVSVINEVGLDPGIDHLFAHLLVDAANREGCLDKGYEIDFVSYCGGVPVEPTDFTYKFSWTPLGVLAALKNEARMIEGGETRIVAKAWEAVTNLKVKGETFEVYPNRNSLPYVKEYGLENEKNLNLFVRGTLRLAGWKSAWKDVLKQVETSATPDLKALSDKLWQDHRYGAHEKDRVVLYVAMAVRHEGRDIWSGAISLDETGCGWRSAMASTVSLTVAQAVRAVMAGRMPKGVSAGVHDIEEASRWLAGLEQKGLTIRKDIPSGAGRKAS